MIRFIRRWYQRIVHNVDPERDESKRACDIAAARRIRKLTHARKYGTPDQQKRAAALLELYLQIEFHKFLRAISRR